jgi:hypothetical protein
MVRVADLVVCLVAVADILYALVAGGSGVRAVLLVGAGLGSVVLAGVLGVAVAREAAASANAGFRYLAACLTILALVFSGGPGMLAQTSAFVLGAMALASALRAVSGGLTGRRAGAPRPPKFWKLLRDF